GRPAGWTRNNSHLICRHSGGASRETLPHGFNHRDGATLLRPQSGPYNQLSRASRSGVFAARGFRKRREPRTARRGSFAFLQWLGVETPREGTPPAAFPSCAFPTWASLTPAHSFCAPTQPSSASHRV